MADRIFSNNASSLLAASIDDNDTVVQVGSGEGALFPSPGAGQFFVLALVNADGDLELTHCTSRTGDLLTVTRAQEGTTAQAWTNGVTRCELRVTAGTLDDFIQVSGDTMEGNLDMDDNELQNARVVDPVVEGGQLVGTAIRGTEDDASNEIAVPSDGSRATAGGSPLVVQADNMMTLLPVGTILMWYGSLGSLPTGWQNCDGTNGSPDLRGSFPRGAGGALALGASGGSATASGNTGAGGAHTPSGVADGHAITTAEMPSHYHGIRNSYGPGTPATQANMGDAGNYGIAGTRYVSGPASPGYIYTATGDNGQLIESNGGDGAHAHTLTMAAVADHTHSLSSVATVPPYKAVYFIMKVS